MKIDAGLAFDKLEGIAEQVQQYEAAGYDGCISAETAHDPMLPLVLAAEHSRRIELLTTIVVAFARSPMTLAHTAHDLNQYSGGRFILGLGSQIRPHITKRFNMPWSHPAARMREFIQALRAIWACWYQGEALRFKGEFYSHTLMTPMFTPLNTEHGAPRVMLAAVGPKMTEVVGEVTDGMILHAFTTRRYVDEVTLPSITRGLERAGRKRTDLELSCPLFVVTGRDAREWEASRRATCKQIAFYASTPAYRGVLEMHGWGGLQSELNAMSKRGEWDEMGERIDDGMLEEFAIMGEPDELPRLLKARWGDVLDRISPGLPGALSLSLVQALRNN